LAQGFNPSFLCDGSFCCPGGRLPATTHPRRRPAETGPHSSVVRRADRSQCGHLAGAWLGAVCDPQALFALWPWKLTVLTARAIGVGFLAVFVASVQFIRENSWARGRIGTVSYLLIGSLQLLALARYIGTVEWSRPGT
jgi:hypothetical protein